MQRFHRYVCLSVPNVKLDGDQAIATSLPLRIDVFTLLRDASANVLWGYLGNRSPSFETDANRHVNGNSDSYGHCHAGLYPN